MRKNILLLSILFGSVVLAGAGCVSSTDQGNNSRGNTPPPSSTGSATTTPTGIKRVINVVSSQFQFAPSTITVNKGDTVELHLTTTDVPHGLGLPDFNVNVVATKDSPKTITFIADKAGTFTYRCTVPCGSGHMNMTGTFIVQ